MKLLKAPYIDQTERYPTGCESISAVMLLQYLGYDITPETFIDQYLVKRDFQFRQGRLYGPHPDDAFIGSPYNNDKGSYGCYGPCIAAAVNRVVSDQYQAAAYRGKSIRWLLDHFIDQNMPVIFWATLNMEPSQPGPAWRLSDREGTFQWTSHQHCLLLVGYDDDQYYFNDPWENRGCMGYDRALVEQRYRELGCQAVVLDRLEETK
jgi:uncharacterized protein YvpB